MAKRGTCDFIDKAMNAEDSGAAGLLVYASDDSAPIYMGTSQEHDATEIGIPAAFIDLADGSKILAR